MDFKKFFSLLAILALVVAPLASADVAVYTNGVKKGTAIELNCGTDGSVNCTCVGKRCTVNTTGVFNTTLLANGRPKAASASSMSSSSTFMSAASIAYSIILKSVGANGASSPGLDFNPGSVLPDGVAGQVLTLRVIALDTGGKWTVTPTHAIGFNKLTFTAVGSDATLLFLDSTNGWTLVAHSTVTIN